LTVTRSQSFVEKSIVAPYTLDWKYTETRLHTKTEEKESSRGADYIPGPFPGTFRKFPAIITLSLFRIQPIVLREFFGKSSQTVYPADGSLTAFQSHWPCSPSAGSRLDTWPRSSTVLALDEPIAWAPWSDREIRRWFLHSI